MRYLALVVVGLLAGGSALRAENLFQAEMRAEREAFGNNCIHGKGGFLGVLTGCGQTLFTGSPFHIAVGSLAPQNGFGAGVAVVAHYTPNENWRLLWNFDSIATPNGSWRAGGYMTAVRTRHRKIVPTAGNAVAIGGLKVEEMPTFHLYGQSTTLNKLAYYGLGPGTPLSGLAWYGMRQTVLGANAILPFSGRMNFSLRGEINGRFADIRANHNETSPSIEQLYNGTTAPGLASQPAYLQLGETARISPVFAADHIRLNYSAGFEEWAATDSHYSFNRFKANLSHTFPLYSGMRSLNPREFNGPDSCLQSVTSKTCPPITRNLEGSFNLSLLYTASMVPAGNSVPFYFDPTLGGSDIDGVKLLPSYADYRFRGPNLLVFRGSFEHSIYKWPIGVKIMVDEGRVGLHPGDLGISHLAHSYAAGFTIHAGGLPLIDLLFAWGGHEGTHTIATADNALGGASSRPSLH